MKKTNLMVMSFVLFLFSFLLFIPETKAQEHQGDDWSALEKALKDQGIITGQTPLAPPTQPPPPPPANNSSTGTTNPPQPPAPPTPPTPPQNQGPTWPGGPMPGPDAAGGFPHDSSNTQYGEYESEGGRLWREFRDGKLSKEDYAKQMKELRERIDRQREEAERAEREAEREANRERARQRAEEGRARAREYRQRNEERRRRREAREAEERERNKKVGLAEGGLNELFARTDNLGKAGTPNARNMDLQEQVQNDLGNHHNKD